MNNLLSQEIVLIGLGKRKAAIANVKLIPGTGKIEVNKKPYDHFFKSLNFHKEVLSAPASFLKLHQNFDIFVNVKGGGLSSQLYAAQLGVAKALSKLGSTEKESLSQNSFLYRDSRIKERRKYGLKKARKASQYSKR
uniref:Ribosomal protein S9 n=1 Tax=Poteriospumella lacustris TaxID=1117027 RepID=A0A7S6PV37_9STRA|nr:ribosomal protein S9 [Poteriospumella lacustris]